jgi:CrcB protein
MKPTIKSVALVFLGGALGTWGRWIFAESFNTIAMLFAVNIIGSILIGFLNGKKLSEDQRALWVVGFCGGFTTMSGVALWIYLQAFSSQAALLVALMFVAGIGAYFLGGKLVRK